MITVALLGYTSLLPSYTYLLDYINNGQLSNTHSSPTLLAKTAERPPLHTARSAAAMGLAAFGQARGHSI